MDEQATYNMLHARIGKDPEHFAAFLIDWCRDNYRIFGLVPKITLNEDGSVKMVEGIQAKAELLMTHSFNDAFEILNGKPPDEFDLEPGYRYIHREGGTIEGKWRQESQYHLPDVNYILSRCGRVEVGTDGYEIVFKRQRVLRARLCTFCARVGAAGSQSTSKGT